MSEDIYKNLREQLELLDWPDVYLFKFIAPNDSEKVAKVTSLFDEGADLTYKQSKNGKYISISVKELMLNAETIIDKYKKVGEIGGVMAL